MRYVLGLCLVALAVPVLAGDPGNPDPILEPPAASWIGKHLNELFAEWGKPKKTRWEKDGKVLVYRIPIYGNRPVGKAMAVPAVSPGVISPGVVSDANAIIHTTMVGGAPDVIATQKAKFYLDAEGIVQREEFGPWKWKKGKKP